MMAGLNLESIEPHGDDQAIDLEVTSNRPDCLGHIGIAREASVLFNKPLTIPPADVKSNAAYLAGHPSTRVTKGAVAVVWSRMWTAGSACGNTISLSDPSYHPTHCAP